MNKNTAGIIAVVGSLALVPFALIARSRAIASPLPRIQFIQNMGRQPRFGPQGANAMFADGRAMRPPVEGTVAREDMELRNESSTDPLHPHVVNAEQGLTLTLTDQDQFDRVMTGTAKSAVGKTEFITTVPAPLEVTRDFLKRGQERFNIYCAPCHGQSGHGDGMVARPRRGTASAAPTPRTHTGGRLEGPGESVDDDHRSRVVGNIYNTITNGLNHMPRYDKQISVPDRWAIAIYVKGPAEKPEHGY